MRGGQGLKQKPLHPLPADPEKMIADTCTKLQNELESLDFDNMDWKKYVPRHSGYIEDYEAYEYFAEDHLDSIFDDWKKEILEGINNGQVVNAVCGCLGMHDVCLNAVIPGSDNIFDDLTDTLLEDHHEMMAETIDALEHTVKSGKQAMKAIEAILNHYLEHYQGMKNYLKYFEPLLISLTETSETAGKVLTFLETSAIDDSFVPRLAVRLASFDEDPLIWREKAEEYMELDLYVAKQLLDHYWTNDPVCFRLVGQKLFREHPAELCDYFSELLFPMFDEGFYKEVLRYKTLRDRDLDLYKVLRDHLTEEEKLQFSVEIIFDDVFKIKVLALEKRYPEILALVQKKALFTWYFTEMITPILNIYPAETFALIQTKCEDMLRNHKKRSGYKHIVEWLQLSLQIKGMEENARHLINELYNRKPALPALKEEMRKAGVVEGKD
ncbi:MAG: hypothetical protein PHF97_09130 [Bacteroidales bacterium]|nr:hypothetical protein [Bacteroidales bacterium]